METAPRPQVVLVRHGETGWSAAGKHTSRTDVALTERGVERAAALGARLPRAFAMVITSPLTRARETCRLAGFGADVIVSGDVTEWDYGEYEGLTTAEIRATRPGWSLWHDGAPGGEQAGDVARRADRVIAAARAAAGDVAIFSHGHFSRVLGARWIEQAPTFGERLALRPAAICVLGWEREVPVLDRWNDDGT